MKRYRLTVTLLEPLCLPTERQSQLPATLRYIPGGVLRGGIAGMHLRAGKSPSDEVFQTLFGDSAVHFPDLLPSRAADGISQVFPLTAESCKRRPGFKDDGGHGVRDTLALRAVAALFPDVPFGEHFRCEECGQDLKPLEGVWNGDVANPGQQRVTVEIRLHTGIDRLSGTGAAGIFYGTEAVSPHFVTEGVGLVSYAPQFFTGRTFLTPDQAEAMQSLIQEPIFIGADKS